MMLCSYQNKNITHSYETQGPEQTNQLYCFSALPKSLPRSLITKRTAYLKKIGNWFNGEHNVKITKSVKRFKADIPFLVKTENKRAARPLKC